LTDAEVDDRLNQVTERFITGGLWRGGTVATAITVYDGMITLPRQLETVLAVQYDGHPRTVLPMWFEFLPSGVGEVDAGKAGKTLIDKGEEFCTYRDYTSGAYQLRAEGSQDETDGASLVVSAYDVCGNLIRGDDGTLGFSVPINGSVTEQLVKGPLCQVFKPQTRGNIRLFAVNPETLDETEIGIYQPGETLPVYRRYNTTDEPTCVVTVYARRAFIPAIADNDLLIPGNLGALKLGLKALVYEDNDDLQRAQQYWNNAFDILNKEMRNHLGPNSVPVQIVGPFGTNGLPYLS